MQCDDRFAADALYDAARQSLILILSDPFQVSGDQLEFDRRAAAVEHQNVHIPLSIIRTNKRNLYSKGAPRASFYEKVATPLLFAQCFVADCGMARNLCQIRKATALGRCCRLGQTVCRSGD